MDHVRELGEGIIAVISAPFVLVGKWLRYFKTLSPREANLARASHGAAIIVIAVYLLKYSPTAHTITGFVYLLSLKPEIAYPWLIAVAGGIWWFIYGSVRSRGPRDAFLALRAISKLAVGVAAFFILDNGLLPNEWWRDLVEAVLPYFAIWCTTTGIV